jgi:hypothetical protein
VVTRTRSAAGEIQYAFARKRPKVPGDEEVGRVVDPMDPDEIRRVTEEGKQALNRVFLLGGNA